MIRLTLPFPPSVNRYWRHVGRRTIISREGRQFREKVCAAIAARQLRKFEENLAVAIDLHPPDQRRRDVDNFLKATLDALEHAGVYENDSQIRHLEVDKCNPLRPGQAVVRIEPYCDYVKRNDSLMQLVCCHGCGRDTYQSVHDYTDPYCERCISHDSTHVFPEDLDREQFDHDIPDWDEDGGDDDIDDEDEDEDD